ncbi:cupin domain-containing protein [Actinomycetospora endophytica]|uniref:Cupin domain-containing protein n=1 Tax=Actinomycetospora endophytica TaxID=2291215 RepID=A0ABS8P1C0_9PSEU|nr:cupin domain-containing protein [Actinomycetospora endophytica]MCD2191782.1 cupin domain-containing protein [Actinomycetospora endophytica]
MSSIAVKNMDAPDETRTPNLTNVDVVALGDATIARMTLQPGWRWSECIKPLAGTDSCQTPHLGYLASGRLHVVADDGTEADLVAGSAYRLAPGHDAWVVGDQPVVGLEFESKTAETYARP